METHCLLFMCVNIKLDKVDEISNLFRTLFLDGFVEVVKEEKTVERSPELSVGNGGELDLLEMEKSKFQIYVKLKSIRLLRKSLNCVKLLRTL